MIKTIFTPLTRLSLIWALVCCLGIQTAQAQGDTCPTATDLPVGMTCTNTLVSNAAATNSNPIPAPTCGLWGAGSRDQWFSMTVPASGTLQIQVSTAGGLTDWAMNLWSGSCGALASVECDDDDGPGLFPFLDVAGLNAGETVYLSIWEWGTSTTSQFNICAIAPPSACDLFPPLVVTAGATIEICEGESANLSAIATGGFVTPSYWANLFFGAQNYQTGLLTDIPTDPFCGASTNVFGMDFDGAGVLYGIDNAGSLVTIDPVSCAQTTVGPTPSQGGQTWSGLAWNAANNTMYATSVAGGAGTLYTIDLATGAPTVIGTTTQTPIWLAIDDAGNAYSADLFDDNLYSVNLATGAYTNIGALGPNLNFAQDADFIPGTSVIIAAVYTGGGGNQIMAVDVTTGMALPLLGLSFPFPGQEAAGFALQAGDPADAYTYLWSPAGDLDDPTSATPIATPLATTTYTVTVSDACGNIGTATQTVVVNTADFADQLNCNSLIHVSLDANCQAELDADDILEGTYPCTGLYEVNVNGTGSNIVDASMVGTTVPVSVTVPGSDPAITCWGNILVEDKIAPELVCTDYTLPCDADTDPRPLPILPGGTATGADAGGQPIGPDGGTVTEVPIAVTGANPGDIVSDVNISIALTHTWSADIDAFLISPNGTTVELATDVCGTGDDWDVTFDQDAATGVAAACAAAVPTLTGTVQPEGNLDDFNGGGANGTWTLMITDDVGGDGGALGAVSITVETEQAGAYEPEVIEPCGNVTLTYTDVVVDGTCADPWKQQIMRTWTGTNASGLSATCVQVITVERAQLSGITAPVNFDGFEEPSFLCTDFPDNPGLIVDADGNLEVTRTCYETNFTLPLFVAKNSELGGLEFIFSDIPSNAMITDVSLHSVNDGDLLYRLTAPSGSTAFSEFQFADFFDGQNPDGTWTLVIDNNHYDTNVTELTLTIKYNVYAAPQGATCENIQFGYDDTLIPICEGSYKILRLWQVLDWCAPGELVTFPQILKVEDKKGPTIEGLSDINASTDFDACTADVLLPAPTLSDDCSSASTYTVSLDSPDGTLSALPSGGYIILGLPIGTYTLTYTATDDCGNETTEDIELEVSDDVIPAAVCETNHNVSLQNIASNEPTLVSASVFDDGSWDNCGILKFEARRMTSTIDFDWTSFGYKCNNLAFPADPADVECIADSNPNGFVNWRDRGMDHPSPAIDEFYCKIPFGCGDIGTTVMVEFRVTDVNGNRNTCMVEVFVDDKVKPVISCPANKVIECHDDVPPITDDLEANPGPGLGPVYRVLQIVGGFATYTDDVVELIGYYPVFDNCGAGIYVREAGSVNNCGVGSFSRIYQAEDAAGNMSSSCVQVISVVNSDPFEIVDTNPICTPFTFGDHPDYPLGPHSQYDDVEWPCDYTTSCTGPDDNTDPSNAGEPMIFEDECDLVAVTYEDTNLPVIGSECAKILRKWIVVDWCQFQEIGGTPVAGYWTYLQIVKVNDTNDPTFDSCDDVPAVDADPNSCVGLVGLTQSGMDACTDSIDLNWSYSIDPDNDGVGPFITGTGSDATGNYPIGGHSITWSLEDGCGNISTCTQLFYVVDNAAPNLVVITSTDVSLVAQIGGGGSAELWASELDLSSFDNCSGPVELTIQNPSLGLGQTSPPASASAGTSFDCDDMPFVNIDLWGRDQAGNWTYVIVQVIVEDNNGTVCTGATATISGVIATEENETVEDVNVHVSGNGNMPAPFVTDNDGAYDFVLDAGENYSVEPIRDVQTTAAALNGVSTYDIVVISKHILGIEMLDSPYKMIAADINNNGSITGLDLVELRKVILFINSGFPDNTNWRFVDENFVFPDPTNPWASTFPEIVSFNNLTDDEIADFVGIKIGDVNNSAIANSAQGGDTRNTVGDLTLNIQDQELTAGEEYTVAFNAQDFQSIAGYQFTLKLDQDLVEFVDVETGDLDALTSDNFGFAKLDQGIITTSWNTQTASSLNDGDVVFNLVVRAKANVQLSEVLRINSRYTQAEAYNENAELLDLALEFSTENGTVANEFALEQNQPNPFKDETLISFTLPEAATATLTIYDVSGRVLRTVEGDYAKGYNEVTISRSDFNGAGVLYYQLDTPTDSATKKMIVID